VKGVLSANEVAGLRIRIEALRRRAEGRRNASWNRVSKARFFVGDTLGKHELCDVDYVFLDPEVEVVRTSRWPAVYFGDSSVRPGRHRGFHKDNVDRSTQTGPTGR
jgi:hypothetical protein